MSNLTYLGDILDNVSLQSDLIEKDSSFLTSQHYSSDDAREVTKLPINTFRNLISNSIKVNEVSSITAYSLFTTIFATANFTLSISGNSQVVVVKNDNPIAQNKQIYITVGNNQITLYPKSSAKIKTSTSGEISITYDDFIDRAFPIGTYYWTISDVNPSTIFGGSWVQVTNTFVLAAGRLDTQFYNTANKLVYFDYNTTTTKRGSETVTLSVSDLPKHTHSIPPHYHVWKQFYDNGGAEDSDESDNANYRYMKRQPGRGKRFNSPFDCRFDVANVFTSYQTGYPSSVKAHNNMPKYLTTYCWRRES